MSIQLPERIHLYKDRNGSAVTTYCGLILELPPGRDLRSINVGGLNTATCAECRHPSNH